MARILLVDDNIVTRSMSRKTLLMAGHSVVDATSARDATDALGSASFEAVVLDDALPDAGAIDAVAMLREHAGQSLPIILLADGDYDPAALAGLAGTPTTRVRKPCSPHELTDAVARAVSAAAARPDTITLPDTERTPERER